MPLTLAALNPDGTLAEASLEADSLEALSLQEPPGFYTVTRTYHGDRAVLLEAHFDRLEESAHLEGLALRLDRARLRAGLRSLLKQAGYPESRFRVTVPREDPERILLAAEPLQPVPEALRQNGVRTATLHFPRANPSAKTNDWLRERAAAREGLPGDVYEGIILDEEGSLLEGLSSNFHAVLDGDLHTTNQGVLQGIARRIVLDVAADLLPLDLRPVRRRELPHLEEAFLSSSSRGVVPIVKIDGVPIAAGEPGPWTKSITVRYAHWIESHLERI
jgi:branched-chain amino acid aminotransferase